MAEAKSSYISCIGTPAWPPQAATPPGHPGGRKYHCCPGPASKFSRTRVLGRHIITEKRVQAWPALPGDRISAGPGCLAIAEGHRGHGDVRPQDVVEDQDDQLGVLELEEGGRPASLPGRFMNSPGSMCRGCPAVENGGRSASRVRCRQCRPYTSRSAWVLNPRSGTAPGITGDSSTDSGALVHVPEPVPPPCLLRRAERRPRYTGRRCRTGQWCGRAAPPVAAGPHTRTLISSGGHGSTTVSHRQRNDRHQVVG